MSLWSRITNVFRGDRLSLEIDEEMESHLAEAAEQGRDPEEARRAFGNKLRTREESRDIRLLPWLESLRADVIFGWRQLAKRKVTSAAAICSLALAIGACTSAFRLIDALLLRPLPVAAPEQLYALSRRGVDFDGKPVSYDGFAYPSFRLMKEAAQNDATLFAVSYAEQTDITYKADDEMEKASLQYVSGSMFPSFGLRPAAGRLFTANDDIRPGGHPYAVLSYDYWTRRFGRDPQVVGRTFHLGDAIYEITGVAPELFTGTEPGTVTDIFVPTMMNPAALRDDSTWIRVLARVKPEVHVETLQVRLNGVSRSFEEERAKKFTGMSKESIKRLLSPTVTMEGAAAGASGLQNSYRRSLTALGVLVALVLLIACANVANLMAANAAIRAREMALRVAIGAGRRRLIQLVLIESAILAGLASSLGGLFAWWSAPFVASHINPPDNPARLYLPMDWRVLTFGLALTLAVTFLFGLLPALRASSVRPAVALKGGADPHSRRRVINALIAVQVAFCFLVLFVAGLFASTFERLSHRPTGFSSERLLVVETVAKYPQAASSWENVAEHLRAVKGIESVAIAGFPLLVNNSWNGFVSINGAPPGPILSQFLAISPGWVTTMRMPLLRGRDFRREDTSPGVAIVNETFAKRFFNGADPMEQYFAKRQDRYRVIGVVHDAPYRNIREAIQPVAFVPFQSVDGAGTIQTARSGTFLVRTSTPDPLSLAATLRKAVPETQPGFRVSNIRTQQQLVMAQTIRERLLAMLALFFGMVALVLAGVGLYGVLNYSVLQRRREIGIRMAIGASATEVARRVTAEAGSMVIAGGIAGVALGLTSVRYIETLLYQVRPNDLLMLAMPAGVILAAACVAALPAVIRAVRIDPMTTLRSE